MSTDRKQAVEQVSDEQILQIIKNAFGDSARVAECQQILGGHNNTLYDVKVIEPAHHIVLRIAPRDNGIPRPYERTIILSEQAKYDLIRRAGVPTINVMAVDGSKKIIDRDYAIVDFVEAVPLGHPSVPKEIRPQIMHQAGRYTALMHSITSDKFGWIMPDGSVRGSESWADVFGELMTETYTNCRKEKIVTDAEADAALECYAKHRHIFEECRTPAFVHNDIWDPNILVMQQDGEWKIRAIIDADGALFAEPEFEFILWDGAEPDFMAGYGKPLDESANAVLRRKFYRMQLYMQYAWFYLVMTPNPGFQASARKTSLDILSEMCGS